MPEIRLSKGDSFVDALVKDPKKVPAVRLLVGFLGKSAESKHLRLYSDANLTSWVDVEEDDVLHQQPLPATESPLGATAIWVKRDAAVKSPAASGFLAGRISGGYGGAGREAPDGAPMPSPITPYVHGIAVAPAVRGAEAAFLRGNIAQGHLPNADLAALPAIRSPGTMSLVDGCPSTMNPDCGYGGLGPVLPPRTIPGSAAGGCPTTTYLAVDPGVLKRIDDAHVANLDRAYQELAAWRAARGLR